MKGTLGIRYGVMAVSAAVVAAAWLVPGTPDRAADWMLTLAGVLLGLAVLLAVALPLAGVIRNPQSVLRSLTGLGAILVILCVGYMLSAVGGGADGVAARAGGTLLYAVYILLGIAVLAALTGEIIRFFRK